MDRPKFSPLYYSTTHFSNDTATRALATSCGQSDCDSPASDAILSDVRLCADHWRTAVRDFGLAAETLHMNAYALEDAVRDALPAGSRKLFWRCPSCRNDDCLWTDRQGERVRCQHPGCFYARNEVEHQAKWTAIFEGLSAAGPVVYYVRFGPYVKIGWTGNLRNRVRHIPYDEIAAVEPGARSVELKRHMQFGMDRHSGEWFHITPELVAHIERMRTSAEKSMRRYQNDTIAA
ncbi:hypothetical protein [Nocardia otitidiscaviarum]|uniref:hypothetical protein n=1 Tax=Nocardia otitidiscaviarum TaxID=1823 RepID=UPI0011DCB1C6|nr:hypothetical protein [Nocardia otitidiscaviarum]